MNIILCSVLDKKRSSEDFTLFVEFTKNVSLMGTHTVGFSKDKRSQNKENA